MTVADQRRLIAAARAAERAQQATALNEAIQRLLTLHHGEFPPSIPPTAPAPPVPSLAALTTQYKQAALSNIPLLRRGERVEATKQAIALAMVDHQNLVAAAAAQRVQDQQELDQLWSLLCANDPDVVLATLAEAFSENEATATAVSVTDGEATLLLMAPSMDVVPEQKASVTAAGNLSIARMPKTERNSVYLVMTCGHLLMTLKETFAVAPGLAGARVVMVRESTADAYGRTHLECLLAGTWKRAAFTGVQWTVADAVQITYDTATELLVNAKASYELVPIDTATEPEIQSVLAMLTSADPTDTLETSVDDGWIR